MGCRKEQGLKALSDTNLKAAEINRPVLRVAGERGERARNTGRKARKGFSKNAAVFF